MPRRAIPRGGKSRFSLCNCIPYLRLRVVTMPEAERNRFMRNKHARRDALKKIEISFRVHPEL